MKSKIKIITASLVLSLFFANTASAALVICGKSTDPKTGCTPDQLVNQVVSIVNFLINSATLLAIAYVFYGGILMVLARGNPAKFGAAKDTMSHAIQGLIIVLIAYMIVNFTIAALTGGKTLDQFFNFIPKK